MNLFHLRYFLSASRAGNLGDAARLHRVTHSTISQAIRSLERELGVELLKHAKSRFELTNEGLFLMARAQPFLNSLDELKADVLSSGKEPAGSLVIGAPQSLVADSLVDSLGQFRKSYPKVKLKILSGSAQYVKSIVASGECDLGLALDDLALESFTTRLYKRGDFVLVGNRPRLELHRNSVIVTNVDKPEVVHLKRLYKRNYKEDLKIEMEVLGWSLIKKLAIGGLGLGYVPRYVVQGEIKAKALYEVRSPGKPYSYELKALWRRGQEPPLNAKLFLELISMVSVKG